MIFVFTPAARRDVERLRGFLLPVSPTAAARAMAEILKATHSLEHFPDRGRPSIAAGARELNVPFGRSANIVRYFHDRDAGKIVVLRIWHGREEQA